jgi:putative SOS response-associated peptidase YedK
MIKRYSLTPNREKLADFFKVELDSFSGYRAIYNAIPGNDYPIIKNSQRNVVSSSEWGLKDSESTDSLIGGKLVNARIKTISAKEPFASLLPKQRCIILADGYYVTKPSGEIFRIVLKTREPFGIAGLWDDWGGDDDNVMFKSFAMITQPAHEAFAKHNDRMPAIVPKPLIDLWLSNKEQNIDSTALLNGIKPLDPGTFEVYEVNSKHFDDNQDSIRCIEPMQEDQSGSQGSLF